MKTTELFNFRFVDRVREQEELNSFFMNDTDNTLWIKGDSGFGKTTFFNYVYQNGWSNYKLCYINITINSNSVKIVTDFISELQKFCETDFLSAAKKNFKQFYNGIYKKTQNISNELFPQISSIISVILDAQYLIVTLSEEKKEAITVIIEYIRMILKHQKLCICIDNFSRCDLETADFFFRIFKNFLTEKYFRSCIITTEEDLKEDLKDAIYHNLPYKDIKIDKLDEYIYFSQILNPIFNLNNFQEEDLKRLYLKCKGSPKKLSTVITKLLDKDGIQINSKQNAKAKIKKSILTEILSCEHIRFDENDFSPIQKWIIFSYLCLMDCVQYDLLEQFALYIADHMYLYKSYTKVLFLEEINNLVNKKILKYNVDNTITCCYDTDYIELMEIFRNSHVKSIFSNNAYVFLDTQQNFPEKQNLKCMHAREANIPGWELSNFRYGKSLAKSRSFYEAQKIFSYLEDCYDTLHPMQKLCIAMNSYETGNYQLAIEQLMKLELKQVPFRKARYYYYFFLGKSFNNIGKIADGADMLEKALKEMPENSKEYVQTLNVLHMYYFEIPGKERLSKEIFKKIQDNYKESHPDIWANTMRGCHNFLKEEEALKVLKEAEDMLDNELEKAFIMTTKGYIYIKLDKVDKAQTQFEEACNKIKELKIHEYSYAANNLAVCYMLENKYLVAREILLEALLWNRTDYGNVVIQVHLMMCEVYLKHYKEANEYYEYLQFYMESRRPKDSILNRKVYMNLAIASEYLNQPLMKNIFFDKASLYIQNTNSEWRYYTFLNKADQYPGTRPTHKNELIEAFDPWFLVYAHD